MSDPTRAIRRLAIVNRGEAAMRCIRTVKALRAQEGSDLQVIALYTAVDRDAPYVRHADHAILLKPRATPVASYLDHDLLLQTLAQVQADAVWPGWGFVAESPEFVDRLEREGIRFLGPSGDTMRKLGDKISSKVLADRLQVPVTGWSGRALENADEAVRVAEKLGLPLVLKASAGGGGRGIRMIEELSRLPAQFQSASSEALSAFGDGRLFLERMVRGGRHIEVQIVADRHGFVRAVGCRDCSVQRRHQKVIEEAPPIDLPEDVLNAMKACAERLAREVRYSGVGTVEFLVEGNATFYFMEMNPRLQVEHGITEEITGLDLVELQIRIARGERLSGLVPVDQGFCIEARVCAEDPDQGFLPAPGEIARFDPASGPHLRVDTGVVQGSTVPAAFDSLIAKVMARGATREQARARLSAALRDFDLVISGGASNKGYLLEVLSSVDYARGGIDTLWLDRWNAGRKGPADHAAEALVLAAVLSYRAAWQAERRNFFADTSTITPDKVPQLGGRELDLEFNGESYRLRVFSVGSWRYRVHLDGRVVSARFGDVGPNAARVVICGRYYRATYDLTGAYIRVELEGCVHRFGRQTAGQVRAGAPSMVVSIDVQPGQRVEAGQHLGLLEAMKMEIAFATPVAGVVTEVRVTKGQQVAAGDVLLVIDPSRAESGAAPAGERLRLPEEIDPLAPLFTRDEDGGLGAPDLLAAQRAPAELRSGAMSAVSAEIARMMLGWDVNQPRFEKILELLEVELPSGLSEEFRRELSEARQALHVFADVDQLFSHARRIEERGSLGPSNNARMRVYLRRMRSQGAGIAQDFLDMLKAGLRHYDIDSLDYSEDVERAVLRMFAAQRDPSHRRRLVMAVLRRMIALVNAGTPLRDESGLRDTLARIAAMRGDISNAVADTALEADYRIDQGARMQRHAETTTRRLESWLLAAESGGSAPPSPPAEVLEDLALSPAAMFVRVEEWLGAGDRWKQVIALSAYVRRLYAPKKSATHRSELVDGRWIDRSRYDGKLVLAAVCKAEEIGVAARSLAVVAASSDTMAIELVVLGKGSTPAECVERARTALDRGVPAQRLTLSILTESGSSHHTLAGGERGPAAELELYGLHPETAGRLDLSRYRNFELERMWAPEDIYCFFARARQDHEDQRLFLLGDVRSRPANEGHDAELYEPIFERAFQEAARTLRLNLGIRDPRRLLYWNRLVMHMAHPVRLDAMTAQRMARKLLANIRHLGVEKTIVRLKLISAERPNDPPREIEVVGSDVASSRLELTWRRPRKAPLVPASPYERKVAEAHRRGLIYPYEIIRMLTSGDEARERVVEEAERDRRPVLPVGTFDEYDLDPTEKQPTAVSVAGRQPGQNQSAIVFGLMTTPTTKVPEGMRRVLILSDPTRGMGALAAKECDRVVAAIDLAERMSLPVEWLPVSSGARVAMDSGTENMDATARVVRRIVTFTQAGGFIHLVIAGINVGAQSYWDALATMLMHTRGALIMTPEASMVLTGSAALAASGSVSADDEVDIGGNERVMGPNGQSQYFASDLLSAYQVLYDHYDYTYVVPGEAAPRKLETQDPKERDVREFAYAQAEGSSDGFSRVGDVFDEEKNPGRKRPFSMRALMRAVIDWDGGHLERWGAHVGAETAIVWDAHIGGHAVSLLGIESQNVPRLGYRPSDGPEEWNGGTLFPQSSKKVARALNAASGNRPMVILANLSGFDGSPESMRKLQLEYGAEIARAVVNFSGPILFLVVSRYHGGAYVVFSRELNEGVRALAVEGSFASVIGGGPAATVVFAREVRARVAADPRIEALRVKLKDNPSAEERANFDRLRRDVTIEKRNEVATEFDSIHTVDRAKRVGSLEQIIPAQEIRPLLIDLLDQYRG